MQLDPTVACAQADDLATYVGNYWTCLEQAGLIFNYAGAGADASTVDSGNGGTGTVEATPSSTGSSGGGWSCSEMADPVACTTYIQNAVSTSGAMSLDIISNFGR